MKQSGFFITLEGTEGSGKSSLLKGLSAYFLENLWPVECSREPGGTDNAEKIRQIVLDHDVDPSTELFLYAASRAEHVQRKIRPALKSGKVFICDRFTDSTLAYQGYGRKLDLKTIRILNQIATSGIEPDLTFWLDLPVEIGLSRASDPNRFEKEAIQFHKRVRKGFQEIAKKNRRRFIRLDAGKLNQQELLAEAISALPTKYKKGKSESDS